MVVVVNVSKINHSFFYVKCKITKSEQLPSLYSHLFFYIIPCYGACDSDGCVIPGLIKVLLLFERQIIWLSLR